MYDCVSLFLVLSNLKELSELVSSGNLPDSLLPNFRYTDDPSSVDLQAYRSWFQQHGNNITGNLTDCDLEKEMQKVKTDFLD